MRPKIIVSLATPPDRAVLQGRDEKTLRFSLDQLAPGLQHGATGMSRSFVRAWATVATIMAMVSFAFIQPMPESGRPVRGEAPGITELFSSDPGSLSEAPPFVDSMLTGKTFTPYVTVDAAPKLFQGAPRAFRTAEALLGFPRPPTEPLIRPG